MPDALRHFERKLPESRESCTQSAAAHVADRRAGRAAIRHRGLPETSHHRKIQCAVPAESVRFFLHDAWVSGPLYILPVAADAFRPRLARAVSGKRRPRIQASTQNVSASEGIFLR